MVYYSYKALNKEDIFISGCLLKTLLLTACSQKIGRIVRLVQLFVKKDIFSDQVSTDCPKDWTETLTQTISYEELFKVCDEADKYFLVYETKKLKFIPSSTTEVENNILG